MGRFQTGARRGMGRRGAGLAAVVVAMVGAGLVPAAATAATAPETVVVQFAPGTHQVSSAIAAAGAAGASAVPHGRYLMTVPAGTAPSVVARLDSTPGVRYAEVAQPVHSAATVDDPCAASSCPASTEAGRTGYWSEGYLSTIGAYQAWDLSKGAGVRVAVLDSGADATNPDLAGKVLSQHNICATDPQCGDQVNTDDAGHGTHVSGILAANTDNGVGVASLGWDVHLDEYKVLDAAGGGNTADVATAIYDAVGAGDRVINLSLANYSCQANPSDCGPDPDEEAAVEYAISHNVVVVAAAGNDGFDSAAYPASYPGVLAVAATDNAGAVQPFSQWGSAANIAAPGVDIVSTWPDTQVRNPDGTLSACLTLCVETGTSMSTPQVSAAAALLISRYPSLTAPQVATILESTARPTTGGNPIDGGLLDVPAALAAGADPPTSLNGYELAGADGSVYSFGSVGAFGDAGSAHLAQPVVGAAMVPGGTGYWLVASDGGIFSYGSAAFYGSTGGVRLARPVVGMAATPDGRGYWLVASDGGVFAFGDARFYGSTGGVRLAKPVVGMAATPDGRGYWLVASDGGVFAFGDARFYGSTGGVRLAKPVVGMAATPDGRGYWMVASDGGIFAYGDAGFHGSTGGLPLSAPVVGISPSVDGQGYWLAASDGGVFNFGDARFYGSMGGLPLPAPVVAIAS